MNLKLVDKNIKAKEKLRFIFFEESFKIFVFFKDLILSKIKF